MTVALPIRMSGSSLRQVVGFPILKRSDFDEEVGDPWLRARIAEEVWRATLQPVSTFMTPCASDVPGRAEPGAAVQGAMFNPRVLVAILNIFRIQYNFFEPRTYVAPYDPSTAQVRIPGRDQRVTVYKRRRHKPRRLTPAMRHGIWPAAEGDAEIPNLMKVLYYPWLYARTPLWQKFTSTGATCGARRLPHRRGDALIDAGARRRSAAPRRRVLDKGCSE
jgi:hypothetical protein